MDKAIKQIETANIDLDFRKELALVYLGEKPATIGYVFGTNKTYNSIENLKRLEPRNLEKTSKLLERISLPNKFGNKEVFDGGCRIKNNKIVEKFPDVERVPIYVATNEKNLERIFEAYKSWDERELGRLYGYPKTAIEAYMGEKEFASEEITNYDKTTMRSFTEFIFSRDNYQEELETSKRWHDAIKNNAPGIYREICEEVNRAALVKGMPPTQREMELIHSKRKT